MWQAHKVAELLRGIGVECDIVQIETRGDDTLDRPLPEIGGDGVFTERIERALLSSEIDIAVHSLKDLPVEDPGELCVGAVLCREEVREVLVSREGRKLAELPRGAVLGSSSTRRQAQLLALRPDLVIRPIRGNVETRIRKVEAGEYEATLLAGAGIIRLGLASKVSEWLEISQILPAPGQGALAVQCRAEDQSTRSLLAEIDEPDLRCETDAERGFLRALGGGCSAPVGAYAQVRGSRLKLRGRVSALDGSRSVNVDAEGEDHSAIIAGLAAKALREGAAEMIVSAARRAAVRPAAQSSLQGLRIVVTRPLDQADDLCKILAAAGAVPLTVPMIRTVPIEDTGALDAAIEKLSSYGWLAFASANAVEVFMKRLETIQRGIRWPAGVPLVAAVGPGMAAALSRHGIRVDLVPAVHSGTALAEAILETAPEGLAGARLLLPRALDGREDAAALLRQHGAVVDDIPIYKTDSCVPSAEDLALLDPGVDAVLFASSSAVSAWCDQARAADQLAKAAASAVIACIGPATASTARERGLRVDVEAATHTTEGLVTALERHFVRVQGGVR
jgi:hydroxymethylbilane synthase